MSSGTDPGSEDRRRALKRSSRTHWSGRKVAAYIAAQLAVVTAAVLVLIWLLARS